MLKKVGLTISGEEQIERLVNSVKDAQSIANNYGPALAGMKKIFSSQLESNSDIPKINPINNDDYWERINIARQIVIMTMGLAVKNYIPRENYKDLRLEIFYGNRDTPKNHMLFGINYLDKDNKVLNGMYLCALEYLATGEIVKFCHSISTFVHELYHSKQGFAAKKGEFSISNLIYSLESVAYTYKCDYDADYDRIFFESEADYYGYSFTSRIVGLLSSKEKDFDIEKYVEILMKKKQNWKNMLFDFDTQCNYVKELLGKIKSKNIIISPDLLDKYPILKSFYEQDGSFKNPDTLIPTLKRLSSGNNASQKLNDFINLLIVVYQDIEKESHQSKH